MDVKVAGPSRIPTGLDSTSRDRQRQLASHQKVERVLGAPAPASFLKLDIGNRSVSTKKTDNKQVILNSPVSKCPTSFLPWSSRVPIATSITTSPTSNSATDLTQPPVNGAIASVPPLNFKRRPHRKSSSMAGIESEMTDFKRDAAQTFHDNDPSSHYNSQASWLRPGEPCITRRQSLPETSTTLQPLMPSDGTLALKRQPRPLPPVPLSRPVSPASSICSSHNSQNSPRPLPAPPSRASIPSPPSSALVPVKPDSPSTNNSHSKPFTSSHEQEHPPPSPKHRPGSDLFSPLSPLSIITDLSGTLRVPSAPSPRSSEARKRHRIHASPYKLARNPTRYSTTSLSSQVSVPPVPPPAELRRRNREKMAKLIRMLGESPPTDLVFGAIERDNTHERDSVEDSITEESFESTPPTTLEPLRRSVSLGVGDSTTGLFGKKKALSDPDAGHGERAQSPLGTRFPPPSSFKHLRSKRGRAGIDKAPRYVLSLFDTAEEKTSERLTFKLNATNSKLRPTGSYLRGAYKSDVKPDELKIPSLPTKIPVPPIDSPKPSQTWVREAGLTRWEVDDYENVVMSLRKL